MTAKEFSEKMNKTKLTIKGDQSELSTDFIEKFMARYTFMPKSDVEYKSGDDLIDLIDGYDTTRVEIGMLTFLEKTVSDADYIYVGQHEADDLVIDRTTKEVKVKEYGQDHILSECAANSAAFLDALFIAASYMATTNLNDESGEDGQRVIYAMANECAEKAGGSEYLPFYLMFLGYEG